MRKKEKDAYLTRKAKKGALSFDRIKRLFITEIDKPLLKKRNMLYHRYKQIVKNS